MGIHIESLLESEAGIAIVSSEFIPEYKVYSLDRKIILNGIRPQSTQAAGISSVFPTLNNKKVSIAMVVLNACRLKK